MKQQGRWQSFTVVRGRTDLESIPANQSLLASGIYVEVSFQPGYMTNVMILTSTLSTFHSIPFQFNSIQLNLFLLRIVQQEIFTKYDVTYNSYRKYAVVLMNVQTQYRRHQVRSPAQEHSEILKIRMVLLKEKPPGSKLILGVPPPIFQIK